MKNLTNKTYRWAIIGAGPAGLASAGLLLDTGISPKDIILIDPEFAVGDFGKYWGEVYSNTSIELFLRFLKDINSFYFHMRPAPFLIESKPKDGYCQLKHVTEPLLWITKQLRKTIDSAQGYASNLHNNNGAWNILVDDQQITAEKVIMATGATPKSLSYNNIEEISLYDALRPSTLEKKVNNEDCIAVFGSSHSSMIIIKNLLDAGVKNIINFYLIPHRYAIKMDGWTLYDNTGLKADTAAWVRKHISKQLDPRIKRYISNDNNIKQYLPLCNKAVYPVGFTPRTPNINGMGGAPHYDKNTGILEPGLLGAGIAFPREITDPFGSKELNVGLYKFMKDIRKALPIWIQYDL